MRSIEPPNAARWLLSHFGCSPNNDAVIGDLDEQYRAGARSGVWYWRQMFVAIVMSFWQEVTGHKLLAFRVLLLGWAIKAAWGWLASLVVAFTACNNHPYACRIFGGWYWPWLPLLLASITIALCIMSVRLVSHISGPHYRAIVLLYVLVELLAVPVMSNAPAALFLMSWAAPFETYFYVGFGKLGYPFETVAALWFGCIAMAVTMLLAGEILIKPTVTRLGRSAA